MIGDTLFNYIVHRYMDVNPTPSDTSADLDRYRDGKWRMVFYDPDRQPIVICSMSLGVLLVKVLWSLHFGRLSREW